MTKKGLYIHLPFCKKFCPFCKFPRLITSPEEKLENRYIDFIISKINDLNSLEFDTIYLGGGTPNCLSLPILDKLLLSLDSFKTDEYTIELNPEFVSEEQIKLFQKHHINRYSLGIQSFSKKAISVLSRGYNYKEIKNIITLFKKYNIQNYSLDLIFNYPGQTFKDLKKDLKLITSLKPKHLSIYDLIIESFTPLAKAIAENKIIPNDNETSYKFYNYIIKYLKRHHFIHYEVSSFCKQGFEGKHNLKYWNSDEYTAIGFGATSFLKNNEIVNANNLNDFYLDKKTITPLKNTDLKQRFLLMGLRKLTGISLGEYQKRFNSTPLEDYPELRESISDKLLVIKNNNLKLTKKGLFLANQVFEKLI